ncbi:MAG: glycosyltransferase family 39 protein [Ignavibacteriales bacterium]|nr:glycosyltransferase family 39 protein [Ignavibacteriales bacterium]
MEHSSSPSLEKPRSPFLNDVAVISYLALATLLIHFLTGSGYGYFRDELYYIACSDHLDWGYIDHPPLSILLLAISRVVVGDSSVFALRLLPVFAGAGTVLLMGLMVRMLGGNRFAQILAAVAVMVAPVYLTVTNFYSMNCFDLLLWTAGIYVILLIVKSGNSKLWLLFGVIAGLGLQNKLSMLFLGFGLVVGLMLTPHRKYFRDKWLWMGGVVAFLIFLPNIIWQVQHDLPTIEFMMNATQLKNASMSPIEFTLAQILMMSPISFLLWFAGLYYCFFYSKGKQYRIVGWMYVAIFVFLVVQRSKAYYLTPVYPMLFATGALFVQDIIARTNWKWLKPTMVGFLIVGGAITAPFALPALPVEGFIRYSNALGIKPPQEERNRIGKLPQMYADMHGWEEMTAAVAEVYSKLSPEEQSKCAIYAQNYGEAGAIDFFGKKYNLPKAISGHNSYFLWGTRGYAGEILIIIGGNPEDHKKVYNEVTQVGSTYNEYAMPYENNRPIFLCRGLKTPLKDIWPSIKLYI